MNALSAIAEVEAKLDEVEAKAATWPRVIKLRYPIDFGSERITSLEMRRGKLGDLKGMKLGDVVPTEQLMLLACRLSGQPLKVIESLDQDDAGEVMSIALSFFGSCLTDGKTPSRQ